MAVDLLVLLTNGMACSPQETGDMYAISIETEGYVIEEEDDSD